MRERHSRQREQYEQSPGKCGHMCMSVCVYVSGDRGHEADC